MSDKLPASFASTDELLTAYWAKCERVKELERENATMHQRVGEWMDDDAERSVRLVRADERLAELERFRSNVASIVANWNADRCSGESAISDVAIYLREVSP